MRLVLKCMVRALLQGFRSFTIGSRVEVEVSACYQRSGSGCTVYYYLQHYRQKKAFLLFFFCYTNRFYFLVTFGLETRQDLVVSAVLVLHLPCGCYRIKQKLYIVQEQSGALKLGTFWKLFT